MKRMLVALLFSASACAAVSAATPDQIWAYLAARGVADPDALVRMPRVALVPDGSGGYGLAAWRGMPVPAPEEGDLPPPETASAARAAWPRAVVDGGLLRPMTAAEVSAAEAAEAAAAEAAKPAAQKDLEAEYFALADALAAEAGDSPMSEADAKDPAKVRAKYSKAKAAKNAAAGQNKKATAEALLAITELRGDLLMVESVLGSMDPRWRERARKPVSP